MHDVRYHRFQRSWANTLSVAKAKNLQVGGTNIIK